MSKKESQTVRTCDNCGKTIEKNDIWYPFFDISSHGGGILYLHARCAVERIFSRTKKEMLERAKQAEKEKDDPLSDGIMNLYWFLPISPLHWVKFCALKDDEKEIAKSIEKNKIQTKSKSFQKQ